MNNRKINILVWAPFGSGKSYWGPGISAFNLYKNFDRNTGNKVFLAHGFENQYESEVYDGYFFISNLQKSTLLSSLIFILKSRIWIFKNYKNFDVVHVLGAHHISFMPAFWFSKLGVKVFLKVPNANSGFSSNSFFSKATGLAFFRKKQSNSIGSYISISSAITKELKGIGISNEKIYYLPNGVNIDNFYPLSPDEKTVKRKKYGLKNIFTLIVVGEICERKNQKLIIETIIKFPEFFDIQFLIVGPSGKILDTKAEIINLINFYNLSNIHVFDFTDDIADLYQISDVFILPSKGEGLSNSMLEALSSGLPAIVTKISGSEDVIIDNINGQFIELNMHSIKEAISNYLYNPDILKNQSVNSREHIVKFHDNKKIMERHSVLFSN